MSITSEILNDAGAAGNITSRGRLMIGYRYKNKRKTVSIKRFRDLDRLRLNG